AGSRAELARTPHEPRLLPPPCPRATKARRGCDSRWQLTTHEGRMTTSLMDIADRGALAPDVGLRAYWEAFCACDPTPDDFADRMETSGLVTVRPVTKAD